MFARIIDPATDCQHASKHGQPDVAHGCPTCKMPRPCTDAERARLRRLLEVDRK